VFAFDATGRLLLQQRSREKYHSAGLWSNTCCGHPRPSEDTAGAAGRRLREEMGFACALAAAGTFTYRTQVGELIEHEVDHVFTGRFDGVPQPDAREVAAWRWVDPAELAADLAAWPERYSAWLALALGQLRPRR
jgi:isopentenyl-diphosphate Delta-isomerase